MGIRRAAVGCVAVLLAGCGSVSPPVGRTSPSSTPSPPSFIAPWGANAPERVMVKDGSSEMFDHSYAYCAEASAAAPPTFSLGLGFLLQGKWVALFAVISPFLGPGNYASNTGSVRYGFFQPTGQTNPNFRFLPAPLTISVAPGTGSGSLSATGVPYEGRTLTISADWRCPASGPANSPVPGLRPVPSGSAP